MVAGRVSKGFYTVSKALWGLYRVLKGFGRCLYMFIGLDPDCIKYELPSFIVSAYNLYSYRVRDIVELRQSLISIEEVPDIVEPVSQPLILAIAFKEPCGPPYLSLTAQVPTI